MNHDQYIDKTYIVIDASFDSVGKVRLRTSTRYNDIPTSITLVPDTVIQSVSGTALPDRNTTGKITKSFYYNNIIRLTDQLGYGVYLSFPADKRINITLPLKPGIKDKRIIDFIFNDNDKVRKQTATDITFIFGEPTPLNCSPIRNGNSNNFDCRCAPILSDSNNFNVVCDYTSADFGFIEAFYGDSTRTDFIRTSKASIYSGTSTVALIDFRTQKDFAPVIQTGSRITTANLSHNYLFKTVMGFGSTTTATIDYRTQLNLPVSVLHGDNVYSGISRTAGISPSINYGESFAFNITPQYSVYYDGVISHGTTALIDISTYPVTNVDMSFYYGEVSSAYLNIETTVQANAQYGDNFGAALSTHTVFEPVISQGEEIKTVIEYTAPVSLTFTALTGENVDTAISSTTNITPVVSFGENTLLNLSYFISTGSEFSAFTGSTATFEIATIAQIKTNMFNGELLTAELGIRPPTHLTANVYSGEVVTAKPNITTGLDFAATIGENVNVTSFDTIPNTYMYHGDIITFELSSQTSIVNNNMFLGEQVRATLKTGPSEPLGTFTFKSGTAIEYDLKTEISTQFRPKFSFNIEFEPTVWDSTYVDLNRYDCCPPKVEDLLYVNLQRDKEVEVRYDIPHQFSVMTDLVAAPILYPKISHGTTFEVVDYDMLLTANFRYGDNVDVLDLYNDLVVDLNSGNPELDGDNVLIETSKDYTEFKNSFAEIGDGTCVDIELAVVHGITADMALGFRIQTFEFVVESAWRMYFYGFAGMRAELNTNVQFRGLNMRMGTELRHQFYEEPLRMQSGENLTCDIIIEYDVEFMDDGCLDNNHIPTTPEGIPIVEETNEMAIEGQYYSRYIRGRCY